MKDLTRRDLLRTSLAAPAMVAATTENAISEEAQAQTTPPAAAGAGRRPGTPPAGFRLALPLRPRHRRGPGLQFPGQLLQDREFRPGRHAALRRQRLEGRRSAARLGHRVALPERSRALQQGLLSAGADLSRHQRRLVSPHLRAAGLRRRQAHHPRIRRRVPRGHGHLQRLLHRPAHRRLRPVQLRRHRFRRARRTERAAGPRGRHPERWLVLRRRGHLPPRLAGEDQPGAREEVGHVRALRRCAPAKPPSRSAPKWRTTARARRTRASPPPFSIPRARRWAKRPRRAGVHRGVGRAHLRAAGGGEGARAVVARSSAICTSW